MCRRLTRIHITIGSSAGQSGLQCQPGKVRLAGRLGAPQALLLRELAFRVNLLLETGEECASSSRRRLARVVPGVEDVSADAAPQRSHGISHDTPPRALAA